MPVTALVRAIRFFSVVPPFPRLMLYAFAVTTSLSVAAIGIEPPRAASAALPILMLQLFATSTGFATHARRGHYDVLLTEGFGRLRTALVQWVIAAAPGIGSWLLLAVAELALAGTTRTLASGTLAALLMVSTLPWAVTVALPRFSGAIGWILLGVSTRAFPLVDLLDTAWNPLDPRWISTLRFFLFPARAAGINVVTDLALVIPALIAAGVSMGVALYWIHRAPLPLESGQ